MLHGRATLLVGDSVTEQLFHFLICDLVRLGYHLSDVRSTCAVCSHASMRGFLCFLLLRGGRERTVGNAKSDPAVLSQHQRRIPAPHATQQDWTSPTPQLTAFNARLAQGGGRGRGVLTQQILGGDVTERAQQSTTPPHNGQSSYNHFTMIEGARISLLAATFLGYYREWEHSPARDLVPCLAHFDVVIVNYGALEAVTPAVRGSARTRASRRGRLACARKGRCFVARVCLAGEVRARLLLSGKIPKESLLSLHVSAGLHYATAGAAAIYPDIVRAEMAVLRVRGRVGVG